MNALWSFQNARRSSDGDEERPTLSFSVVTSYSLVHALAMRSKWEGMWVIGGCQQLHRLRFPDISSGCGIG